MPVLIDPLIDLATLVVAVAVGAWIIREILMGD